MPAIKTNIQMIWISSQVKEKENSDLYMDNPNDSVPNTRAKCLVSVAANMDREKEIKKTFNIQNKSHYKTSH